MKRLLLKFYDVGLITDKDKTDGLGSNYYFYPINKYHVYNMLCVLMDLQPKPSFKKNNVIIHNDLMNIVENGLIDIKCNSYDEVFTEKKAGKFNDKNNDKILHYTWDDVKIYLNNDVKYNNLTNKIIETFNISIDNIVKMGFMNFITFIHDNYDEETLNNFFIWLKNEKMTQIKNYYTYNLGIKSTFKGFCFNKKILNGFNSKNVYNGYILLPFTEDLYQELYLHGKTHSNLLDGGIVEVIGYDYFNEYDFIKDRICLNDTCLYLKKFNKITFSKGKIRKDKTDYTNTSFNEINIMYNEYYNNLMDMYKNLKTIKNPDDIKLEENIIEGVKDSFKLVYIDKITEICNKLNIEPLDEKTINNLLVNYKNEDRNPIMLTHLTIKTIQNKIDLKF